MPIQHRRHLSVAGPACGALAVGEHAAVALRRL